MSVRIITGDAREILPTLPADSFDCVVTSPPYFGLRDYGVEGQIGLEPTLAAYLETMVDVMREVRRVMKPSGCAFLNIGDSYCSTAPGTMGDKLNQRGILAGVSDRRSEAARKFRPETPFGMKPKDLMMVPNRLAILLQDDGWWIRSEIIWHKLNPMPESVRDRPTCAHEKVWLLTKSPKYYFDAGAIEETAVAAGLGEMDGLAQKLPNGANANAGRNYRDGKQIEYAVMAVGSSKRRMAGFNERSDASQAKGQSFTRNCRNIWTIASEPYRGAHYAVMPSALAERCIKAGSSEKGCCPNCGKPWERVVESVKGDTEAADRPKHLQSKSSTLSLSGNGSTQWAQRGSKRHDIGWRPTCDCPQHEPIPARVLDCFGGAGTTGLVADRLGRDATLIELNPANRELGAERVRMDGPLFAEVSA